MYDFTRLTRQDIQDAADRLGVDHAVIKAITEVEARSSGFIRNSDLPAILFEGHVFHKLTDGLHSKGHPTISYPKWTKKHYKGGVAEYGRLRQAAELDLDAALKSTSWGLFQIMGFNHKAAGYPDVRSFVNAMGTGEKAHLDAFVSFVESNPKMLEALRSKQWAEFARRYNGPGYKQNAYDAKLAGAFARALADPHDLERGDWMAVQAALNVAANAGLTVDGWEGPKTRAALHEWQEANGLPATGQPDPATLAALGVNGAPVAKVAEVVA